MKLNGEIKFRNYKNCSKKYMFEKKNNIEQIFLLECLDFVESIFTHEVIALSIGVVKQNTMEFLCVCVCVCTYTYIYIVKSNNSFLRRT